MDNENNTYNFRPFCFEELGKDIECNANAPGRPSCPLHQLPEPRSGHRTVCDDGNLFSFGGYLKTETAGRAQHRLFEELWCFNFAEDRWKFLLTTGIAPKELASHCAFLYGNYLHVFGGTGVTFGESTSNKLTRCDLRTLHWDEVKTTGDPPEPQYGQAIVLDETKRQLYIIGGTTGYDFTMDVHKLDLVKGEWELIYACKGDQPSEPAPRYRHEVAFDGENIYVFGGGTSLNAFTLKIVPAFNIMTRKWTMLKTKKARLVENGDGDIPGIGFPSRRKCHSSVQIGDDVFICGGCNTTVVNKDIWKFHIPTRKWQYLPIQLPIPLSFHTASITSAGCMYIFGGVIDVELGVRTNRIFKIWLKIPKLSEICWEALLNQRKDLRLKSRMDLLEMGIPRDFVKRVHPSPPSGKPDPSVEKLWESDLMKIDSSCCSTDQPRNSCVNSFV